jgi:hypothetical protein
MMNLPDNQLVTVGGSWTLACDQVARNLDLHFSKDPEESEYGGLLQLVCDHIELFGILTVTISDENIVNNPLGVDWKILEACWSPILKNGGGKIIVKHPHDLPAYITYMYTNILRQYGVPIELEFRSEGGVPREDICL